MTEPCSKKVSVINIRLGEFSLGKNFPLTKKGIKELRDYIRSIDGERMISNKKMKLVDRSTGINLMSRKERLEDEEDKTE